MISALGLVGNNCFKVIEFHRMNRTNFVRVMLNMSVEHNLNSYVVSDILAACHIYLHCLHYILLLTIYTARQVTQILCQNVLV